MTLEDIINIFFNLILFLNIKLYNIINFDYELLKKKYKYISIVDYYFL
mgnify:FL=1